MKIAGELQLIKPVYLISTTTPWSKSLRYNVLREHYPKIVICFYLILCIVLLQHVWLIVRGDWLIERCKAVPNKKGLSLGSVARRSQAKWFC